jgi:ureidoacrylate peracid hydrolase
MGAAQGRHRHADLVSGIVTNGGVASTVRDAHVRDFFKTLVLSDGCAAFSRETHERSSAISGPSRRS